MSLPGHRAIPDELFLRLQTALAGEYSIERELGRGGMGVVYLAREVRLTREVAIKVLPPALSAQAHLREQFVREAQTAARLSHPNIVPIHRVDDAGGFVYFVMAYVAGETLAERVRARGPLPPHVAARVLRDVAWALTYAHANGIVHRDVKADNILLERGTDRALVTDFGIAGAMHASGRDGEGQVAGSAHYASPEQIAGEPVEAASDIYSLGVTGFLALTGRLPFDAPSTSEVIAMHLNARAPSIVSIAPTVPSKLAQIVQRCMAKRPEQRFESATAFAEALEQAVEPPREIPPAIRVWLTRTNQNRGPRNALAAYATLAITAPLVFALHAPAVGAVALVVLLGAVAVVPAIYRTRRVLAAGYDIDDLRVSLREYWARRREEVVYEHSVDIVGSPRVLGALFGMGTAAMVGILMAMSRATEPTLALGAAFFAAGSIGLGSGALLLSRLLRRHINAKLGVRQIKFYDGKWGRRLVQLAGLGLKRSTTAQSMSQLTEVALGRATDALFDALPKPVRKQLAQLPATVRRLEEDARKLRGDIERLDDSIATLDGDARGAVPSAIAASQHEAGVLAERDTLRHDLRTTRERSADRLAATVAALENIRLDLLRLQLGDARIESVTATLEAARGVADDLGAYADATAEVDRALREPREPHVTPEPDAT